MTNHDKTKVLAKKVKPEVAVFRINDDGSATFEDGTRFDPFHDRNDLADVLAKLTPGQWEITRIYLYDYWKKITEPVRPFILWTHTCDPAIIADAVYEVVAGTHSSMR